MDAERERRVAEPELRTFVGALFRSAGLDSRDAAIVTDSLVSSDLRGTHSHGVIRTPFLVDRLLRGGARREAHFAIVEEAPATALVDGDNALGAVTATRAMELAIAKAATQGIGMVCVRNSDFIGACAHYAMMALPRDMIGIAWTNGFPQMTAWGARGNAIGNNPVAFAAPTAMHGPLVLDMALSVAAGGRIRLAAKNGDPIPADWLLDRDGRASTDPRALAEGGALLPLGYKGFGLAVFGELLCGVLSGSRILDQIPAWHRDTDVPVANGHLHIAIDIARFIDPQAFRLRADAMIDMLKAVPLLPDAKEILMPGERAWRAHQDNRRDGVPITEAVVADLHALAARLGIDVPVSLVATDVVSQ
jgi:LDH2 family malate/lactate/ureidoglycolate dehydrogenase